MKTSRTFTFGAAAAANWNSQFRKFFLNACLLLVCLFAPVLLQGQFVYSGTAVSTGGNCHELTPATGGNGAVWYVSKINLAFDFHIEGDLHFGTNDANGADGIAFVLQPISNGIGNPGGGMGFAGISPSLAVEFDTWQNPEFNDPSGDHVALMKNGVIDHEASENLHGPVTYTNVEDGLTHPFIIDWNATMHTLQVTLDGVLHINYTGNIVANVFSGTGKVFWGLTAATGTFANLQSVCLTSYTFTEDPAITWTNNNGNNQWSTGGNWTGTQPPAVSSDVVFNAATPGPAEIDTDVDINSLEINEDYNGVVNLNDKTLSTKEGLTIKKAPSFNSGTGTVKLLKGQPIKVKPPLYNVKIETPAPDEINLLEDLVVNNDLTINSPVALIAPPPPPPLPPGPPPPPAAVSVKGNVDINAPMPASTSAAIVMNGPSDQTLKSPGGGIVEVQKQVGKAILAQNSAVQQLLIKHGVLDLATKKITTVAPLEVRNGGKLAGKGTVGGPRAKVRPGGRIAPGPSPGPMIIEGDLEIEPGGVLEYEVPPTPSGAIEVQGDVNIGGSVLEIMPPPPPPPGAPSPPTLIIIDNNGPSPVGGTFAGYPEGSPVPVSDDTYTITYSGGGNGTNVVLNLCPSDGILYVDEDATGANTGSSWADAYNSLQDALANTCPGITQIWVAEGTYTPTTGTDRSISFVMKNGVAIYGGFNGTETMLSERNWVNNVTTLSGDIGDVGNNSDNSYHVISNNGKNNTAALDGFTISGGNANGSIVDNFKNTGGGMLNQSSSPTVSNCIFTGNSATDGAGMGNLYFSGPIVTNCIFRFNAGSGMFNNNDFGEVAIVTNCLFYNNSESGIYNINGAPIVTNSTFYNNSLYGMYSASHFSGIFGTVTNSIFWNNGTEIVSSPDITFSIVQGGYPGMGNLDVDPIFVNPPSGGQGGDLHLQPCSPAINAGTATGAPAADLEGNPRPAIGGFDMGAYEFLGGLSFKVTCYRDNDDDGFGNLAQPKDFCVACGAGYVSNNTDCNDSDENINPSQPEVCDGTDNDCDGFVDTADPNLVDNEPPAVTCKNHTVSLSATGAASITPADVFLSGSDNCGTVNLQSVSPNVFSCANVGGNTVTLTVNDGHGNENTCTATVNVQDNTPPSVVCKNHTAVLNIFGSVTISPANVFQSGSDNCGTVNLQSVAPNTFNCFNIGNHTVTLYVNDGHLNTATCTATVTVADAMPPLVVCKNHTVALDANGAASITPAGVFQSGSDNCGTVNLQSVSPNVFSCANVGGNTVTLTVNDGHGNTNTCTATVTVQDDTPPTITCPAPIVKNNDPGLCSAVTTYSVSGSDNCTFTVTQTAGLPSGSAFPVGETTNFWKVTDASNNMATCSFTVTVLKSGDPELLWAYTAIGFKEVKMKLNTVQSGGVGVVNAGEKAKLENGTMVTAANTFVKAPVLDLNGGSQVTTYHPGQVSASLLPAFQSYNGTCSNNLNIPDNSAPVTLNLACYKDVTVGKNVSVTFSGHATVNVRDLKLKEGSLVSFAQNTDLLLDKKLDADKNVTVSNGGNMVWIYVNDQVKVDDGSSITANVYSQKPIKVEKTSNGNPTWMTGIFIGEKIDSKENVFWNWNPGVCPFNPPPMNLAGVPQFNAVAAVSSGIPRVNLSWVTDEDALNSFYSVEKTLDGQSFEPVLQENSRYHDQKARVYQNTDPAPAEGDWLYRLKVTRLDGTTAYSDLKMVRLELPEAYTLFPNPASGQVSVSLRGSEGRAALLQIVNGQGIVVEQREVESIPAEPLTFDLSSYRDGMYYLNVQVEGRRSRALRFVVAKPAGG